MQPIKQMVRWSCGNFLAVSAVVLLAGCHSDKSCCDTSSKTTNAMVMPVTPAAAPAPAVAAAPAPAPEPPATPPPAAMAPAPAAPAAPAAAPAAGTVPPPVRIKAGLASSLTDSEGNVWLADQGFADGETTDRPDVKIENTKAPEIYHSERYSMTSFSYPVPNGKYLVKLYFAETFEGITGPGERVFSFNVEGQDFKDFDVWVKSGGALHAYVETVPVEVADGKVDITFTPKVENPEINGIEIIPAP